MLSFMFRISNIEDFDFKINHFPPKGTGTVIDCYDGQDFNLNEAGWIRNDISQLARASSKAEFDMIMSKLQVLAESGSLPKDISLDEAFKQIRPRWCQAPNELEWFAEFTNPDVMAKLDEAYQKSVQVNPGKSSEFSEGDNQSE